MTKIYGVWVILIVPVIFFTGCKESSTESVPLYSVSGIINQSGKPLSNAAVAIDQKLNFQTSTDHSGYFMISGVPEGEHTLTASKSYDDGSFAEISAEISLYQDLVLNSMILPAPVKLYAGEQITASSVDLRWTTSDAPDFREYKVFRHTTSGLDEHTGTLVHISTARFDTVFTDNSVTANQTYYYRVYVMNDLGRLGGSNLISLKTPNRSILQNGDFEIVNSSTNLPESWTFFVSSRLPVFKSDNTTAFSGTHSLLAELFDGNYLDNIASQIFAPSELISGEQYRISLDFKHDSLLYAAGLNVNISDDNFGNVICSFWIFRASLDGMAPADWQHFSATFVAPSGTGYVNYKFNCWLICNYQDIGPKIYRVWIDNIKLEKI